MILLNPSAVFKSQQFRISEVQFPFHLNSAKLLKSPQSIVCSSIQGQIGYLRRSMIHFKGAVTCNATELCILHPSVAPGTLTC